MKKQTIVLGSDHAGYELKEVLKASLKEEEYVLIDKGTFSSERTDYPDYAHAVSREISGNKEFLGVLICGSANGVSMAANKHAGIRAAIAWTAEVAKLARTHNDANIISLPARFISIEEAKDILKAYLGAVFEGGRHGERVNKIDLTEKEAC